MKRPLLVSGPERANPLAGRFWMKDTPWIPEREARRGRALARIAGFVFYLFAVQALLTAAVGLQVFFGGGTASDLLLPGASFLLAGCYAGVGFFLRRYRLWARNFAFAFSAVIVFAFPLGTTLGAIVVLCLERANRSGAFGTRPVAAAPAPSSPPRVTDEAAVASFEMEFASEHAG
jgi:hypothetical protein